jgi:hypothetical protein
MKKLIPLLIVGMMVLIGLGAAAVPYDKEKIMPILQPEVHVKLKRGFSFGIVAIVNWTGTPPQTLECNFTCSASIMILGSMTIRTISPKPEPPAKQVHSGFILGLGPASSIMVSVKIPGTIPLDQDSATGFVLGPFVYVRLK